MQLLLVEDDIYEHLVRNMREIGEQPSAILRRLLRLRTRGPRVNRKAPLRRAGETTSVLHELSTAINGAPWLPMEVQRYLYLLARIAERCDGGFELVLGLRGRTRRYFAMSAEKIERSGKATAPRRIAGTPYWALTNMPMREKERILRNVMALLGFTELAMLAARRYLVRVEIPTLPTPF
jgi:negative modulator of initiation of replication